MNKKIGFTLMEIVIVMIILGILITIALPSYFKNIEQTNAQTAQNNLLAISAAQQKYYEDNSSYCVQVGCGDTSSNLFAGLRLSYSSTDPFQYTCSASGASYTCTATDNKDTLVFNPKAVIPAAAVSCYTVTNAASCPITCSNIYNSNSYCPSNLQ